MSGWWVMGLILRLTGTGRINPKLLKLSINRSVEVRLEVPQHPLNSGQTVRY